MRAWNKLSASFVRSVRREGRYSDGGNLYLQVANGGKSWIFQYQRHGLPSALSRFKTMNAEDARGGVRTTQAKKNKPLKEPGAT